MRWPSAKPAAGAKHRMSTPSRSLRRGRCKMPSPKRRLHKAMTLQKAKSIARRLGITLRELCSGDYRVNFRQGDGSTAYYTNNLEDAVNSAVEMSRKRPAYCCDLEAM